MMVRGRVIFRLVKKVGYMGLQVDWEGGHGVLHREPGWIYEVVGHQVKLFQSTYIVFVFVFVCLADIKSRGRLGGHNSLKININLKW